MNAFRTRLSIVRAILLTIVLLSVISSSQAQGLDLNRHCADYGHGVAVLVSSDAYGWKCKDSSGTLWNMSIQRACDDLYGPGTTATYRDFNDPNSWYCQGGGGGSNPSPSNPQPSSPSGNSGDRGCSISEFWMSHHGTVQLGTNIDMNVSSNCGSSKLTINGQSRAEQGAGGTLDTMKTSEWGVGTYEICGLARGNGGWENADRRCETLVVTGGNEPSAPANPGNQGNPSGNTSGSAGSFACNAWIPVNPGGRARITAGDSNRLRTGPGTNHDLIGSIAGLTEFSVLSGPYCNGGHTWIEIRTDDGRQGYTAVGTQGRPWVEGVLSSSTKPVGRWCSAVPDEAGFFGISREGHESELLPNPRFELHFSGNVNFNDGTGSPTEHYVYYKDEWVGPDIALAEGWRHGDQAWSWGIASSWYVIESFRGRIDDRSVEQQAGRESNWRIDYWRPDGKCRFD